LFEQVEICNVVCKRSINVTEQAEILMTARNRPMPPVVTAVNPGFNLNEDAETKHYFVLHGTGMADNDEVLMVRRGGVGRRQRWSGTIIQTLVAGSTYLAQVIRERTPVTAVAEPALTTSSGIEEIRITVTSAVDNSSSGPLDMQNVDVFNMP
jgi:hypothetical protein